MWEDRPQDHRGGRPWRLGLLLLVLVTLGIIGQMIASRYPEFRALRSLPFAVLILYVVYRWADSKLNTRRTGRDIQTPRDVQERQAAEQTRREAETEAEVQRILRGEQHRDR
jgi:hypothetical protein